LATFVPDLRVAEEDDEEKREQIGLQKVKT